MPNIIEVSNLTKYYNKTLGIDNLNFTVREGEIFGFLGPNGAGKTTTIRLLLHLLKPTGGQAKIFGKILNDDNYQTIIRDIGYLPGELELFKKFTGQQILDFSFNFRSIEYISFSKEIIDWLGCEMGKPYGELSKGNKQKIGILLTIFHNPKILILDEPTNGLDPVTQNKFYQILLELKKKGTTILFSSHNLPEVEKICDRVGIIKAGKLVKVEDLISLKQKYLKKVEITFIATNDLEKFITAESYNILEKDNNKNKIIFNIPPESINDLINTLSSYKILDLNFSTPTLEDMFLTYY